MRQIVAEFDLFAAPALPHEHARELETIDQILLSNPGIAKLIWKDLRGDRTHRVGRPGLAAEQVLRAAVIKQMNGFSYDVLAFHLADSRSYMRFCGFTHPLDVPSKSALADNIKRISAETWEAINGCVLGYAEAVGIEDARTVRIDPTVVESNVHHPTDNALLFDGVRSITPPTTRSCSMVFGPWHGSSGAPARASMSAFATAPGGPSGATWRS